MEELKLNDFLSYRFLSQVQYAPGGKRAAFAVSNSCPEENSYESRLYLWENGAVRQLTDLGKESRFVWEDETHLLFPAVRSKKEIKRAEQQDPFTAFYRLDIGGGEALPAFTAPFCVEQLKPLGEGRFLATGSIDALCPDLYAMGEEDRRKALEAKNADKDYEVLDEIPFWSNGGGFVNKSRTALFLLSDGKWARITPPHFNVDSFTVLNDKIYFSGDAYTAKPSLLSQLWVADGKTGQVRCLTDCSGLAIQNLTQAGGKILVIGSRMENHGLNENAQVFVMDPETGDLRLLRAENESMYSSVGSDCRLGGGESFGSFGGSLYHITTRWGNSHLYRLDPDGTSTPVLEKEGSIDCISVDESTGAVLMAAMFDQKLQELYLLEPATGEVTRQTFLNEDCLKDKYVAAPRRMVIRSCGLDIEGWVLEPKDYDSGKRYPGVLDIHGGPKTVYGSVFYHEMQLWANRGYFVFFCNPMGSDGRGNDFMDIRGAYGRTDYQNIMDFTDAVLKAYPQIDPARVAVTGGSYGGFMTNWIIGHTDRFACAASQRSISNWLSFYGASDIGYLFAEDQCGGNVFDSPEKMWEHSPLRYAGNVKTPTLFIHSDEDYRCPMAEGLQMYTALVHRGIPARLCCFHGENHELSRSGKPQHRVRRLQEITDWIEKYTKE
ncbi:MAG: S9 family peptidase [Firmicutes bacterium]|nr:S9 family peptidase [Bacillota bacterium]